MAEVGKKDYFPPVGANGLVVRTPPVTLDGLRKHVKRYGLDKKLKRARNGQPVAVEVNYTKYKQLRNDSVYEVARYYLGRNSYLELVRDYDPTMVPEALEFEGWDEEE